MFQNPEWILLEILVIAAVVIFLGSVIGVYIYKKIHHMPTGECACCHKSSKQLVKQYHKECCHK